MLRAGNTLDPAYFGGWTNGSDGGLGFGPWALTSTSSNLSDAAFFVDSSTNNGTGGLQGIDMNKGNSWGISASGGNMAVAYRGLTNPLTAGGMAGIDMDTGYVDAGNSVGFVLRNGNVNGSPTNYTTGALFEFLYIGGDVTDNYKVAKHRRTMNEHGLAPGVHVKHHQYIHADGG